MGSNRHTRLTAMFLVIGLVSAGLSGCIRVNEPPLASFTRSPEAGDAPLSVFFDGSASFDSDGYLATYQWDFGDGATAAGISVTHTYTSPGTYQAELTVTDGEGKKGSTVRAISVTEEGMPPITGTEVGEAAPAFTLKSIEGLDVTLDQYRGQIVLLDFWRSTCPPCRTTLPHLDALRAKYEDDGLIVVTVSLDASQQVAEDYLQTNGLTEFVTLWGSLAEAEAVRSLYGVEGIPHTFLIDRQGVIRYADHPIRLRDWHIEPWL